jgi:hypothetical protein
VWSVLTQNWWEVQCHINAASCIFISVYHQKRLFIFLVPWQRFLSLWILFIARTRQCSQRINIGLRFLPSKQFLRRRHLWTDFSSVLEALSSLNEEKTWQVKEGCSDLCMARTALQWPGKRASFVDTVGFVTIWTKSRVCLPLFTTHSLQITTLQPSLYSQRSLLLSHIFCAFTKCSLDSSSLWKLLLKVTSDLLYPLAFPQRRSFLMSLKNWTPLTTR